MKRAVIFTVCVFAIGVSGQPNKTPAAAQNQAQTQSPSTTLNFENCNVTSTQPDTANNGAPDWNTAIKRAVKTPDGWLVIVAVLTGLAIAYQAREMARATKEMRNSIDLQKVAFSAWVVTDNWHASYPQISKTDGGFTTISFDIINPTNFPITVTGVCVSILDDGYVGEIRPFRLPPDGKYKRSINVPLPSARPSPVGGINVDPDICIVNVFVDYKDVLSRPGNQQFGMECSIESAMRATFNLFSTVLPEPKFWTDQKKGQNPN